MTMAEKINRNEPYNIFFNAIPALPETVNQNNSITFADLLCPSLGELSCSLQLTYILSSQWLMEQYEMQGQEGKPLTVLYGKGDESALNPNVEKLMVNMENQFGTHHAKVGMYVYKGNSVRVVVSTANLTSVDWNRRNQSLWVSPLCPALSEDATEAGESPTGFKSALIRFLEKYSKPILNSWINYVKQADFSAVRVVLITSAPGDYKLHQPWPLLQVKKNLSEYCKLPEKGQDKKKWYIVAQVSHFGTLGNTEHEWLKSTLLAHLASPRNETDTEANLKIVYPSQNNISNCEFIREGGSHTVYSKKYHKKQEWLQNVLHQWKAKRTQRTCIIPHTKTYCRVSPCHTKLAWFLLSSSNISKAAWGYRWNDNIRVLSYEVGVLFLPHFFEEDYLYIEGQDRKDESRLFPFMYDLPLRPYDEHDQPHTAN